MLTRIEATDPRLCAALAAEGLPTSDLDRPGRIFFAKEQGSETVAFGGLEIAGSAALLRSVVMLPAYRGQGQGRALVEDLVGEAKARGVGRLWLLTTTAADFFARAGFERCDRSGAPAAIAATTEFQDLCPASAVCMRRSL